MKNKLCMILAVSNNHVIGKDGKLPWDIPEDMAQFKRITMGHPCIMGMNTYLDIGKPLHGRPCYIVSANRILKTPMVTCLKSFDEAVERANLLGTGKTFVIGGVRMFQEACEVADELYLTRVRHNVEGDTYFEIEPDDKVWRLNRISTVVSANSIPQRDMLCDFQHWVRR